MWWAQGTRRNNLLWYPSKYYLLCPLLMILEFWNFWKYIFLTLRFLVSWVSTCFALIPTLSFIVLLLCMIHYFRSCFWMLCSTNIWRCKISNFRQDGDSCSVKYLSVCLAESEERDGFRNRSERQHRITVCLGALLNGQLFCYSSGRQECLLCMLYRADTHKK